VSGRFAAEHARTEAELVLDDRPADRETGLVPVVAPLRRQYLRAPVGGVVGEARCRLDIADRAAFRTAAEERALRPAQPLGPFEIEQRRHGRAVLRRKAARGAFLQRRFVEIKARGCGRRTLLANAANGYRRIAGRLAARQSEPGY